MIFKVLLSTNKLLHHIKFSDKQVITCFALWKRFETVYYSLLSSTTTTKVCLDNYPVSIVSDGYYLLFV